MNEPQDRAADQEFSQSQPQKDNKGLGPAVDDGTIQHSGEEIFGWSKTIGSLCKTRFIGQAKKVQILLTFACYNLIRMTALSGYCLRYREKSA